MGIFKRLGVETAFQTFNNYLSNIVRKRNATIVGPSRQITGEFPEVTFQRLFEYYHGWDQIKRAIDTMHQKFMGAGIEIRSKSPEFDDFVKKWMEIVNFQKKMSDFYLNVFVTGNAILEKQFTEDGRIGNISVIPMQTIYRVFRDEFGNDLKIVQNIDGIFKELDPEYYVRWAINNPDRQAFGKSEFHTLAAPRKVASMIDPETGEAINPERSMVSLLDAQAELQNSEVEIKKIMSKPRIFASFPGMPQAQLNKIQKELQDENSRQTIWAFDKEARMVEAQYSGQGKFQEYGQNVDQHIDIGTGFASQVISHPGGFSYSSSQTPFDVLDQRMVDMQADAREMLRDGILRPLAHSWGINDFDDLEVEVYFQPSVRRLTIEDIQRLPLDAVSPEEKREILKTLHIPLDDMLFDAHKQKTAMGGMGGSPQALFGTKSPQSPETGESPIGQVSPTTKQPNPPNPMEKDRPDPTRQDAKEVHRIYKDPTLLESYIKDLVVEAVSNERITLSPKTHGGNMFTPGGLFDDTGAPEVTELDVIDQILKRFDDEEKWKSGDVSEIDDLTQDLENDVFSQYDMPAKSKRGDTGEDRFGTISTPYPETDISGVPNDVPSPPQKTKANRYPSVLNDDDEDRRRSGISDMLGKN